MIFAVELAIGLEVAPADGRRVIGQDRLGTFEIGGGQPGNSASDQVRLQHGAQIEELGDVGSGELRDDGAAMGMQRDQPLRCELMKGFTQGNAADAEFARQCILAQRLARGDGARQDAAAQLGHRRTGDGLAEHRPARARGRRRDQHGFR